MRIQKLKNKEYSIKGNESLKEVIEYEPVVENVSGRTTIQLFENEELVEETVSDNFIAIGMKKYLEYQAKKGLLDSMYGKSSYIYTYSPIRSMRLVMGNGVERPVDDIFTSKDLVGNAYIDTFSTNTSDKTGLINTVENKTSELGRKISLVADFSTEKANGTFNEVHLSTYYSTSQDYHNILPNVGEEYLGGFDYSKIFYGDRKYETSPILSSTYVKKYDKIYFLSNSNSSSIKRELLVVEHNVKTGETKVVETPQQYSGDLSWWKTSQQVNIWYNAEKDVVCTMLDCMYLDRFTIFEHNPETFEIINTVDIHDMIVENLLKNGTFRKDSYDTYYINIVYNEFNNKIHFFGSNTWQVINADTTSFITDSNYVFEKKLENKMSKTANESEDSYIGYITSKASIIRANGTYVLVGSGSGEYVRPINIENELSVSDYSVVRGIVNGNTHKYQYIGNDEYIAIEFVGSNFGHTSYPTSIRKTSFANLGAKNVLPKPITKTDKQTMKITYELFFVNREDSVIVGNPPHSIYNFKTVLDKENKKLLLSWDKNLEEDMDGYFIYIDNVKRFTSPQKELSYTFSLDDFTQGTEFKIHVTAVNTKGLESDYAEYYLLDRIIPDTVQELKAIESQDNTSVELSWTPLEEDVYYNIYMNNEKIFRTELSRTSKHTVTELTPSTDYSFYIVAEDDSLNFSLPSETAYVDMKNPSPTVGLMNVIDFKLDTSSEEWNDLGVEWNGVQSWIRNHQFREYTTVKSNTISHNGRTSLDFKVNSLTNSDFSITYITDSEYNYDKIRIYIDNELVHTSGSPNVVTYNKALTEGLHNIRIEYGKDGSASNNTDSAYIIDLSISNLIPPLLEDSTQGSLIYSWTSSKDKDFDKYNIYIDNTFKESVYENFIMLDATLIGEGEHTFEVCAVDISGKEGERASVQFSI